MKKLIATVLLVCGSCAPVSMAAPIDQEVANKYNDAIVRCSNESCAKYLYACFRSYSAGPLAQFVSCGTQAARLNDNKVVIPQS